MKEDLVAQYRLRVLLVGFGAVLFVLFYFSEDMSTDSSVNLAETSDAVLKESSFSYTSSSSKTSIKYSNFRTKDGAMITFQHFLEYLENQEPFAEFFVSLLKKASFDAFFFECPALIDATKNKELEFVLVKAASLSKVPADDKSFREHFSWKKTQDFYSTTFKNLGNDATLVVPYPNNEDFKGKKSIGRYAHLAAFIRNSTLNETLEFLRRVGSEMNHYFAQNPSKPVWLSTSGLGIYWLHIRMDSRPKYYTYSLYKDPRYLQISKGTD